MKVIITVKKEIMLAILKINNDLEISLSLGNIILGLLLSIFIGIIAGFFPSNNASKLNPVEAINTTF